MRRYRQAPDSTQRREPGRAAPSSARLPNGPQSAVPRSSFAALRSENGDLGSQFFVRRSKSLELRTSHCEPGRSQSAQGTAFAVPSTAYGVPGTKRWGRVLSPSTRSSQRSRRKAAVSDSSSSPAFAPPNDLNPSDGVALGSAYWGAHMTTRSGPSPSASQPLATIWSRTTLLVM